MQVSNAPMVWHPHVHERFGETLNFYFITFYPDFDVDIIFKILQKFLSTEQIKSYSFWEVFGPTDIVLKAWTPGTRGVRFADEIRKAFSTTKYEVIECERLQVAETLYGSKWICKSNGLNSLVRAEDNCLNNLTVRQISDVQNGRNEELKRSLIEKNLCAYEPVANGIKTILTITPPWRPPLDTAKAALVRDVIKEIDQNTNFIEKTIYATFGHRAEWVVEATVSLDQYTAISLLNSSLNSENILNRYRSRTTTFLGTGLSDGVRQADGIHEEIPVKNVIDMHNLVTEEESSKLEKKSSLEIDVRAYLATGTISKNIDLRKEILRTIVAFLNSSDGGYLLIGTIEADRFKGNMQERLEEFPSIGNVRICGIEWEYGATSWDGFQQKLSNLVRDRIGASVGGLIEITKAEVKNKTICLIAVSSSRSQWSYLDDSEFWIRDNANSRLLSGHDQESYQNEHPRRR